MSILCLNYIIRSPYEKAAEGCLERISEDNPEEEQLFRDLWEDETQREVVMESLKVDSEVKMGRP